MSKQVIAVVIHGLHEHEKVIASNIAENVKQTYSQSDTPSPVTHWVAVHWEWLTSLPVHIIPEAGSPFNYHVNRRDVEHFLQSARFFTKGVTKSNNSYAALLQQLLTYKLATVACELGPNAFADADIILAGFANGEYFQTTVTLAPKAATVSNRLLRIINPSLGLNSQSANDTFILHQKFQ